MKPLYAVLCVWVPSCLHALESGSNRLKHARLFRRASPAVSLSDPDTPDYLKPEQKEAEEFTDKVQHADAGTMLGNEIKMLKRTFFPGMNYSWGPLIVTCSSVFGSVLWFVLYFRCVYKNDRHQDHHELDTLEDPCLDHFIAKHLDIRPDLIIVFHHPHYGYEDKEHVADVTELQRCLVADKHQDKGKAMPEVLKLQQAMVHHEDGPAGDDDEEGQTSTIDSIVHRASLSFMKKDHDVTQGQVREALLRDMYHGLMKWGFDVLVFSSVDYDELFMCISMQSMDTVYHYLAAFHSELQIQRCITQRLGIDVPMEEAASSPPYIRFDQRVIEKLYQTKAGKPPYVGVEDDDDLGDDEERIIASEDPRLLFRVHDGGRHKGGSIVSSLERIHLIFREISNHLDLDAAKELGFLVDWYPVHSLTLVAKLRDSWANMHLMTDFSFVQPVSLLSEYFGSRVAFRFAWSGLYCKALMALLPLAVMCELSAWLAKQFFGEGQVDRMMVASFNVVVIIWSKVAYNLWAREEAFFATLWGMGAGHQAHYASRTIRPSFRGEPTPSVLDRNLMEKTYPAHKLFLRWCASTFVTLAFCVIVWLLISFWYKLYEGRLSVGVIVVVSVQIKLFELLWNMIAPVLADFENHKYQNDYYDSYLWKHFLFQMVNSYCAFFYMAMNLRFTPRGCPPGGCLKALRQQLIVIQIIISFSSIATLAWQAYRVELQLWHEMYELRRSQGSTMWEEFMRVLGRGPESGHESEHVSQGGVSPTQNGASPRVQSPTSVRSRRRSGMSTDEILRASKSASPRDAREVIGIKKARTSPSFQNAEPASIGEDDTVEEHDDLPLRSYAEEQSKHAEFRVRQQIESMCMLVISLGYVLIFGAVAPIMVPFCMGVFVLELRLTALMLTTLTKRTVPRGQLGIGAWKNVIMFIMKIGVAFSGFLLVTYGDTFANATLLAKISAAVGFCVLMVFFWEIVDVFLPPVDTEVYKLSARRTHVEHRIRQACKHEAPRSLSETHIDPHGSIAAAFREMRYHDVPPLDHFPTRERRSVVESMRGDDD